MKQLSRAGLMVGFFFMASLAVAQEAANPIVEAWPIVGLLLASGLVLLAAEVVKSATAWLKLRLRHRMGDVPHWLIHTTNATLSVAVALLFFGDGRLSDDPAFGVLAPPWIWIVFAAATFLRAGGSHDEQTEHTQELARHRQ